MRGCLAGKLRILLEKDETIRFGSFFSSFKEINFLTYIILYITQPNLHPTK